MEADKNCTQPLRLDERLTVEEDPSHTQTTKDGITLLNKSVTVTVLQKEKTIELEKWKKENGPHRICEAKVLGIRFCFGTIQGLEQREFLLLKVRLFRC